jgi:hypothetical protein
MRLTGYVSLAGTHITGEIIESQQMYGEWMYRVYWDDEHADMRWYGANDLTPCDRRDYELMKLQTAQMGGM